MAGDANQTPAYGWVSPLLGGVASYFGSRAGANAQAQGDNNAIGTEQALIPTLTGLYGSQRGAGNGAFTSLGASLGLNGGTPDYSAFNNSPGYQFALQQGQQAINRQAAATGGAYSSTTLADIGNYAQGMAAQNYNNYINQLMQVAGYGASGNANLGQDLYGIGANIGQAQIGKGSAYGAGATAAGSAAGGIAQALPWGKIISGVGSWFNSGNGSGSGGPTLDYSGGSNAGGGGWNPSGNSDPYSSNFGIDYSFNGAPTDSSAGTTSDFSNMNSGFNSSDYNSGGF